MDLIIKKKLESNIWKMYVITALNWFLIIMPTIVLFFQENGLSLREVLILQSVFSIGMIIFEIPSGYFSDVLGRKNSLVIGCFLSAVGLGIFGFSFTFWGIFYR